MCTALRRAGTVLIVLALVLVDPCRGSSIAVGAQREIAGQMYRFEWPFRNVYAYGSVDYVQVASVGNGQAGGRIAMLNRNGSCAYVQFKASPGIWHHRTEKVCEKRLDQWVWFYWKDDFLLYNGGSYSFRTCISDWFRDSCGREYKIQVAVS